MALEHLGLARELGSVALLGFALAASPGPVNALAFARGLRHGAAQAVLLALGADTADVLYATLVILGAGPFVDRPAVQVALSLGGGLFLAHLGIANLRAAWREPAPTGSGSEGGSRLSAYRQGFTVALLSPLTIVFWMSVFGGYYAEATARGSRIPPALLLAVLMLGAAIWTALVALLIHFGRRSLRGRWYAVLVTALSILLLAFAMRLLWTGALTLAALPHSPR
jgi:threonine/homoserine/homoserine lactone efflux protein